MIKKALIVCLSLLFISIMALACVVTPKQSELDKSINKWSRQYDIDPLIIKAIIYVETGNGKWKYRNDWSRLHKQKWAVNAVKKYDLDPSNIRQAFEAFDMQYGLDSKKVLSYIENSKKILSKTGKLPMKKALNILSWYELFVQMVLNHNSDKLKRFLKKLRKIDTSITKALWETCQR